MDCPGKGLAIHERYGYVELTSSGQRIARDVQKRHDTLARFLTGVLGIDRHTAGMDACKMEHSMSPKTFDRLTKFMKCIETCPEGEKPEWISNVQYYFETGKKKVCATVKMKRGK